MARLGSTTRLGSRARLGEGLREFSYVAHKCFIIDISMVLYANPFYADLALAPCLSSSLSLDPSLALSLDPSLALP